MACTSCAQRRAIMNKMATGKIAMKPGLKQIGQTVKNDAMRLAKLGKLAPKFR